MSPNIVPVQITGDGRSVFMFDRSQTGNRVLRVDLASGRAEVWKELRPADPVGVRTLSNLLITPDGKTLAYRLVRNDGELYVVTGLR